MNAVLKGYLQLMRPANLPTSAADIFAGAALAGILSATSLDANIVYLVLSSVSLYAGGVVLNDVFDYDLDKIERPERPLPSGLIPLKYAATFGSALLIVGVLFAFFVTQLSGILAFSLACAIVLYDAYSKKYDLLGPLNMGLCRGLNLLLGMSIFGEIDNWWYAGIPLVYIFAITLISRGEVHGNNKNHIIWAGALYGVVILSVVAIVMTKTENILQTAPFLALFAFLVVGPLVSAFRLNSPENIKKAVMSGVLSIIVLDACLAVGFSGWWYGLLLLLLLPLSILLSKVFAVT